MPKLRLSADTRVSPDRVLQGAIDFTDKRPDIWPGISRKYYEVHQVGGMSADVTEGSDMFGGIWARERYDWSEPNTVRATIQESNIYHPGGTWEMRVEPRDGGSHVEVRHDRRAKGLTGRLMAPLTKVMGPRVLTRDLEKTLEILEREAP